MIAVMAVAAISANAQVYVGGGIGFSSTKVTDDAKAVSKFKITPEVGYAFNDDMAVGLAIGFASISCGESVSEFSIKPYFRYAFAKTGNVAFFIDGAIEYATTNGGIYDGELVKFDKNAGSFAIGVAPGIKFSASKKVDFVAKTGLFGYKSYDKNAGNGSEFNIGVDNTDLSFSAFYNF